MSRKSYNIENLFKALADQTRLRLIGLLGDSEVCVCFLVEILKTSQPKISRHLAYLRRAQIVSARREGKWMHYRLIPPPSGPASRILAQTLDALVKERRFETDRERLKLACCEPQRFVSLSGVPQPSHPANPR